MEKDRKRSVEKDERRSNAVGKSGGAKKPSPEKEERKRAEAKADKQKQRDAAKAKGSKSPEVQRGPTSPESARKPPQTTPESTRKAITQSRSQSKISSSSGKVGTLGSSQSIPSIPQNGAGGNNNVSGVGLGNSNNNLSSNNNSNNGSFASSSTLNAGGVATNGGLAVGAGLPFPLSKAASSQNVTKTRSLASMPLSMTMRATMEPPRAPFVVKDKQVECDIFNRVTLTQFLNEKLFADVTLTGPDGSEHAVHRVVVGRGSLWIHRQLLQMPTEQGPWRLAIPFPDPGRVLPQVLRALYTGQIEITSDSATAINNLARHMEIPELTKQVAQYLSSTVQRHNCVSMLRQAIELQADDVADACINVVARNFSLLREKDWNWLSYKLFLSLLQAEFFQAESEVAVYELISSYIAAHKNELTAEEKRKLQEEPRFRFFSLSQLQEVVARADSGTGEAPIDLMLEGALAKLEELERKSGQMRLVGTKKHLKRRQTHGLQFPFTPELEMKGIVHYLATNGGKDEYANPHLLGALTVSASSLERGLMLDLVALEPNELWTRPVPASWFCVDFKNRRVRPHHYSLRHGGLHKTDFLRHWDLLGSNDGQTWSLLRRHTADNSLRSGNFAISTWDIVGCRSSYRMFRVIQTGHNSSRHNFLALSGFEIYGELFAENDVALDMEEK